MRDDPRRQRIIERLNAAKDELRKLAAKTETPAPAADDEVCECCGEVHGPNFFRRNRRRTDAPQRDS